jgi:hypothetical protein
MWEYKYISPLFLHVYNFLNLAETRIHVECHNVKNNGPFVEESVKITGGITSSLINARKITQLIY